MKPNDLLPGDVLLFRPRGIAGYAVSLFTWSKYCHAAVWTGLDVVEIRECVGGRCLPITEHAAESIDVFRPIVPIGVRLNASLWMQLFVETKYSFGHGIAAWINRKLPKWLRWLDECDKHGYHCSQAVSKAYRESGLDLCPDLTDWAAFPGDLANSPSLRCVGTLEFD